MEQEIVVSNLKKIFFVIIGAAFLSKFMWRPLPQDLSSWCIHLCVFFCAINASYKLVERTCQNSFYSGLKKERRVATLSFFADLTNENINLKAEVEELKAKVEALQAVHPVAGDDIPYTLWREVLAMRKEGKTDKEIAQVLYDMGQGLSKSQLGALLYAGNEKMPASKTLQEYGTKLFR